MREMRLPKLEVFNVGIVHYGEQCSFAEMLAKAAAAMGAARRRKIAAVTAFEAARARHEAVIQAAVESGARFGEAEVVEICDSDADALTSAYGVIERAWRKYEDDTFVPPATFGVVKMMRTDLVRVPDIVLPTDGDICKYQSTVTPLVEVLRKWEAAFDAEAAARMELDEAEAEETAAREAFVGCVRQLCRADERRSTFLSELSDFAKKADAERAEWRVRMEKEMGRMKKELGNT